MKELLYMDGCETLEEQNELNAEIDSFSELEYIVGEQEDAEMYGEEEHERMISDYKRFVEGGETK